MKDFCETYNLKNLIKEPTCFKNPENPSCIDLMLTNKPSCFQGSVAIETGLSDFHKMCITVMKLYFEKQKPTIRNYRDYRHFSNEDFWNDLSYALAQHDSSNICYNSFHKITLSLLNIHAPVKQKYVRANQSPFINKAINKAIMNRSRLRNRYLKNRTFANKQAYNKQRNYCVNLIRKTKKEFYRKIDTKIFSDNKLFWRNVKPFFSEKTKIILK